MVFVLNKDKTPLVPCHSAVARKLLKENKAKVYKTYLFTIILTEQKAYADKQEIEVKIDYGSKNTGIAVVQNKSVLFLAEIAHRTDIHKNMKQRSAFRRNRRNRKTGYRQARFNNRTREKGWLPPSLKSKADNIKNFVNRLEKICPVTKIVYENVKFDTQLMRNPEIEGTEYQQGTLKGYEVREYLLEKFGRKCIYCGTENVPLEIEHLIPKSRSGTDRTDNLGIACHKCNQAKGNKTAEEFGYPNIQAKVKETLKDAASMNATRWRVYEMLQNTGITVECGTGALTKMNRIKHKLPKTHYYDACCIGHNTPNTLIFKTDEVLKINAKGRGSHQRTNTDDSGFPKAYLPRTKFIKGFQTGDIVKAVIPKGKYKGIHTGAVACRTTGYFDIKDNFGHRIVQGISFKYCKIVQKYDGYNYKLERREKI